MKITSFTLLLSIAVLFSLLSSAQKKSFYFDQLDSIPAWMEQEHTPGLAIGILENNKIKEIKIYGELDAGIPMNENGLFNVASLTKPVVAITVLKLIDAGLWQLDEPISRYWIDPDIKDDPRHNKLTTRIILSHQTGFPNWRVQTPSKKLTMDFDPGTKFGYSGEGYEYLRRALEAKFGKTLQQLSDSVLFTPIALNHTRYSWDTSLDRTRYAVPHGKSGEVLDRPLQTRIVAADWLITTIEDYCKFGVYVMKGAGLSKKLFSAMTTPQVSIEPSPIETMGLGWEVIKNVPGGDYVLTHTGHDDGVSTLVLLLPASHRGFVIFTNGDKGLNVISTIAKSLLRMKYLEPYLNDL